MVRAWKSVKLWEGQQRRLRELCPDIRAPRVDCQASQRQEKSARDVMDHERFSPIRVLRRQFSNIAPEPTGELSKGARIMCHDLRDHASVFSQRHLRVKSRSYPIAAIAQSKKVLRNAIFVLRYAANYGIHRSAANKHTGATNDASNIQ